MQKTVLRAVTLWEVVMVLAISAIISLFAYPVYVRATARAHTAEAALFLLHNYDIATQFQLRGGKMSELATQLSSHSAHDWYHLKVTLENDSYQLSAIPTRTSVSKGTCGIMSINASGERSPDTKQTQLACW